MQYYFTDELAHASWGHKYIDKIKTTKGWRYIYEKSGLKAKDDLETNLKQINRVLSNTQHDESVKTRLQDDSVKKSSLKKYEYDKERARKNYVTAKLNASLAKSQLGRSYEKPSSTFDSRNFKLKTSTIKSENAKKIADEALNAWKEKDNALKEAEADYASFHNRTVDDLARLDDYNREKSKRIMDLMNDMKVSRLQYEQSWLGKIEKGKKLFESWARSTITKIKRFANTTVSSTFSKWRKKK